MAHLLQLSGVSKRFGNTTALDQANLELHRGEVHAIIGENGAGKSTLMNIIAGAIVPDLGTMQMQGRDYRPRSPLDALQNGIALIHQELSLFPHLTVAENISIGMESSRLGILDRTDLARKSREVLENFQHPEIDPNRRLGSLPLASRQIVEICRAVARRAKIILMDEPTSSLPAADLVRLFELIRRLKGEGITIVYISHFLEEVREVADTYTVLRDGKSVDTGRLDSAPNDHLISQMVGRRIQNLFPTRTAPSPPRRPEGNSLLKVRDLVAPPRVKNATFDLHRGEILGIAGLIGSGRTELVRAIFGLQSIRSGTIEFKGLPIKVKGPDTWTNMPGGIGYVSEDRGAEGLATGRSLADNITLSSLGQVSRFGILSLSRQRKRAGEYVRGLTIKCRDTDQSAGSLSGGNQQKILIARTLCQNADVLLLDEPTRGIDIGSKAEIYEIIARCAADGKAVLMVSSNHEELLGLCDRMSVMCRGRLSRARPIQEWTPQSVIDAAIGTGEHQE
jgi:ribose transport system ATP-binding protein